MANFNWLNEVQERDWPGQLHNRLYMTMTRSALAEKSNAIDEPGIVEKLRVWVFAQNSRNYAVVWTNVEYAEDSVTITLHRLP